MRRRLLAVVLISCATPAFAQTPVYDAPDKAPDAYGPLVWRAGGVDTHGFWFSDRQVQAADLRIRYLEDKAAKECIASTNEANKKLLGAAPSTWILAGAALVVGVAGGFYAAKHF